MLATKGTIVKGLVGQEQHQDGNLHLHAYVKFADRITTRLPAFFDIEFEGKSYHGKYEPAKSAIASIKYISKEDKQPMELGSMDWKQEQEAKEAKKKVLGKRLIEGASLVELVEEDPGMLFEYKRWQAALEAYRLDKARAKPVCTGFIPNTWGLALPIRQEKQKHYWFWSTEPNRGKTKFLEQIDAQFRASWYNKSEVYQHIHKDS